MIDGYSVSNVNYIIVINENVPARDKYITRVLELQFARIS